MDKDFCSLCNNTEITPPCIITKIPSNPNLEDIILRKRFVLTENLICHTYAQIYENHCLKINEKCDECGLCLAMCNHHSKSPSLDTDKLEKAIFNDLSKICILLTRFCPSKIIATEVQVKGNFRTKRVDLCISDTNKIYLIKFLKTLAKFPFYSRSYDDILTNYSKDYPNVVFKKLFVAPKDILINNENAEQNIIDLKKLLLKFGEKDVAFIK